MKEKINKVSDLGFLFAVVAVVEWIYAIIGVFTPPSLILPLTGWVLNGDGHWLAKLFGGSTRISGMGRLDAEESASFRRGQGAGLLSNRECHR